MAVTDVPDFTICPNGLNNNVTKDLRVAYVLDGSIAHCRDRGSGGHSPIGSSVCSKAVANSVSRTSVELACDFLIVERHHKLAHKIS
jgi:hypothetical protein